MGYAHVIQSQRRAEPANGGWPTRRSKTARTPVEEWTPTHPYISTHTNRTAVPTGRSASELRHLFADNRYYVK